MMQKRTQESIAAFQGAVNLTAFGHEDLAHCAQVERVGHQRVERIARNGYHTAAPDGRAATRPR